MDWSIQGPLEGFLGLSDDLERYNPRLKKYMLFLMFVVSSVIIFLSSSLVFQTWELYLEIIDGLSIYELLNFSSKMMGTILLLAIIVFVLLILFQAYRFYDILYARFEGIGEMWSEDVGEIEEMDDYEIKKGNFDPFISSLQFTEDVSLEVPQLIDQIKNSSYLVLLASSFLIIDFVVHLVIFDFEIGFFLGIESDYWWLFKSVEIILGSSLFVGWFALEDLRNFFDYFFKRYKITEMIENEEKPLIPEGEDSVQRYKRYLLERDGFLKRSLDKYDSKLKEDGSLEGTSGDKHRFDLIFVSDPGLYYVLLVKKKEADDIDRRFYRRFKEEVEDVLSRFEREHGKRPWFLRAVILSEETGEKYLELDDDFVESIDENPVELREGPGGEKMKTHIQIVVESGETYSVYPFLPEGVV